MGVWSRRDTRDIHKFSCRIWSMLVVTLALLGHRSWHTCGHHASYRLDTPQANGKVMAQKVIGKTVGQICCIAFKCACQLGTASIRSPNIRHLFCRLASRLIPSAIYRSLKVSENFLPSDDVVRREKESLDSFFLTKKCHLRQKSPCVEASANLIRSCSTQFNKEEDGWHL